MNHGIGRLMVAKIIKTSLSLLFVCLIVVNPVSVAAQEGLKYCKERYNTEDINQCIYSLHKQGIYYVDPVIGQKRNGCSEAAGSLDSALSLTYPNYSNEDDVAVELENYIRTKKPNSPWLTVPNLGKRMVEEGKKYNANPFLMLTIGKTESGFSTTGAASTQKNNPFGIKASSGGYVSYPTVEAGLFNDKGILAGLQKRLAEHPNYKSVTNMYEYFSVHNTGQILYPGDGIKILDPLMNVYVSSDGDTGYGPVEYWNNAMNDYNAVFGTSLSTLPPERGGAPTSSSGGSCGGSSPAGEGGWDLPGEGPNPLVYFSQLYGCDETPPTKPRDRSFAKTCDSSVGDNAFGSSSYGTGTMEECGCGPTSLATIISTTTGNLTTPDQVAQWSQANGGVESDGCGSNWFWIDSAFQSKFGVTVTTIQPSEVASTLNAGKLVLVSLTAFPVETSAVGHISVIRKVDSNGNFFFADTYSGGWSGEAPEGASRMPFTQAQISSINKGLWAVGAK